MDIISLELLESGLAHASSAFFFFFLVFGGHHFPASNTYKNKGGFSE